MTEPRAGETMSDLVARLVDYGFRLDSVEHRILIAQAADEIERLTARCVRLEALEKAARALNSHRLGCPAHGGPCAVCARLRDDVLRALPPPQEPEVQT